MRTNPGLDSRWWTPQLDGSTSFFVCATKRRVIPVWRGDDRDMLLPRLVARDFLGLTDAPCLAVRKMVPCQGLDVSINLGAQVDTCYTSN